MSYYNTLAAKELLVAIKKGLAMAKDGQVFRITWAGSEITSEAAFHAWFQENLDKRINHKAGLRTDGAPFKKQCHCRHCMGLCRCGIVRLIVDGRERCGYGCGNPWGGRKWENEWEAESWRLSRKLMDHGGRLVIHRSEVPLEFRKRFAHRIEETA